MEMFLMALCLSMFGVAVAALAFKAATRPSESPQTLQPTVSVKPVVAPARFFSDRVLPIIPSPPRVPVEVLLRQIEDHVRLEQAAAESFVEFPTEALLYTKTISPFVN